MDAFHEPGVEVVVVTGIEPMGSSGGNAVGRRRRRAVQPRMRASGGRLGRSWRFPAWWIHRWRIVTGLVARMHVKTVATLLPGHRLVKQGRGAVTMSLAVAGSALGLGVSGCS